MEAALFSTFFIVGLLLFSCFGIISLKFKRKGIKRMKKWRITLLCLLLTIFLSTTAYGTDICSKYTDIDLSEWGTTRVCTL